jgi:hypothetical protein
MQSRMRQVSLFALIAVAFVVVVGGGTALAQSSNPHLGTWKLDLAKSKYNTGRAPKSATTKIEGVGTAVKYTVDQVSADGTKLHWEFTANYDGKDSPVAGNNPNADMVALTRVNPNTVKLVSKKGGKVTTTQNSVVSSDGKTRTITTTGTDPQGRKVNTVAAYDKQ